MKKIITDTSIDAQFDAIPELLHYPWIGKNYFQSERRVLIVGDSHYSIGEEEYKEGLENKDYTRGMIRCGYEDNINAFSMQRNLARIFVENNIEVASLWDKIAFCNIVQSPVHQVDECPTEQAYAIGGKCLQMILELIRPTDCIIVGLRSEKSAIRIWEMEGKFEKKWTVKVNGVWPYHGIYHFTDGNTMNIIGIKHTSRAFSKDLWLQYIREYMPEASDFLFKN